MSALVNTRTGQPYPQRDPRRNPLSGSCKLSLRRVCGVCVHFDGDLRAGGTCARFKLEVEGRAGARDCASWARK